MLGGVTISAGPTQGPTVPSRARAFLSLQRFPGKALLPWEHSTNYSALQKITYSQLGWNTFPSPEQMLPRLLGPTVAAPGSGAAGEQPESQAFFGPEHVDSAGEECVL